MRTRTTTPTNAAKSPHRSASPPPANGSGGKRDTHQRMTNSGGRMSDMRSNEVKFVDGVTTLIAIALCVWIEAHTVRMAWHDILRVYLPVLPVLGLWQGYAVMLAVRVVTHPTRTELKEDEREARKWLGLRVLAAACWTYAIVWAVVKLVVTS